jgi:hypothetical protein
MLSSFLCLTLQALAQGTQPSQTKVDPWLDIGIEQRTRYETLDIYAQINFVFEHLLHTPSNKP